MVLLSSLSNGSGAASHKRIKEGNAGETKIFWVNVAYPVEDLQTFNSYANNIVWNEIIKCIPAIKLYTAVLDTLRKYFGLFNNNSAPIIL